MNPLVPQIPASLVPPNQPVQAGARSGFDPTTGIINLDQVGGAGGHDPTHLLVKETLAHSGLTLEQLKDSFKLESSFQNPLKPQEGRVITAEPNPPGPDQYSFTRHWIVKYTDTTGSPQELHFTKKIYTNVQVPAGFDATAHQRQQYLALAASTAYSHVEEARMHFAVKGEKNALYSKLEADISKIAHDRFISMDLFHGADALLINPKDSKKLQEALITSIQFNIRAGSKSFNATNPTDRENDSDAYHMVPLATDGVAMGLLLGKELKDAARAFNFQADRTASSHSQKVAILLKKQQIIDDINLNMPIDQAFAKANVTRSEVQSMEQSRLEAHGSEFHRLQALFGDRKAVKRDLMPQHGDNTPITSEFLDRVLPEQGRLNSLLKPNKDPLALLTGINREYGLTAGNLHTLPQEEQNQIASLIHAGNAVYDKMDKENKAIDEVTSDLVKLKLLQDNDPAFVAAKQKRDQTLADIKAVLDVFLPHIPAPAPTSPPQPAAAQQQPPTRNQQVSLNLNSSSSSTSEEDSLSS